MKRRFSISLVSAAEKRAGILCYNSADAKKLNVETQRSERNTELKPVVWGSLKIAKELNFAS